MAILCRDHLILAENRGYIAFNDRLDYSAFSLDMRLEKLYKRKALGVSQNEELEMSQETFMDEIIEEIPIDSEFILEPDQDYFWQPVEEIFLRQGLKGKITTRSSWARLGIRVQSESDEYLKKVDKNTLGKPLCTIRTTGTRVKLKKLDAVAQLFVEKNTGHPTREHIISFLEQGSLVLKEGGEKGKQLRLEDIEFHGGPVLTMDPQVFVYNGEILIPGEDNKNKFERVQLSYLKDFYLPPDTFFISSSHEYVQVPSFCVGIVTERNSLFSNDSFKKTGHSAYLPPQFASHPNAPYIGPVGVFEGQVTFENQVTEPTKIIAGMKQSELLLDFLSGQITNVEEFGKSRYDKQNGATTSRSHEKR